MISPTQSINQSINQNQNFVEQQCNAFYSSLFTQSGVNWIWRRNCNVFNYIRLTSSIIAKHLLMSSVVIYYHKLKQRGLNLNCTCLFNIFVQHTHYKRSVMQFLVPNTCWYYRHGMKHTFMTKYLWLFVVYKNSSSIYLIVIFCDHSGTVAYNAILFHPSP